MSVFRSLKGLVGGLFAPASDPRKTLAYTYHHQNQLLGKVHEAILKMQAAREKLAGKCLEVAARLPKLESDARAALALDDEPRARLLLQRRQIVEGELDRLEAQLNNVNLEEQRLTMQIESLLARQELIMARHSAAEAQVYINQELGAVRDELAELGLALEDAEARAERLRQRALVLEQNAGVHIQPPPEKISPAQVEKPIEPSELITAVDEALEQLKKEQSGPSSEGIG
jgi:phage shock protein A